MHGVVLKRALSQINHRDNEWWSGYSTIAMQKPHTWRERGLKLYSSGRRRGGACPAVASFDRGEKPLCLLRFDGCFEKISRQQTLAGIDRHDHTSYHAKAATRDRPIASERDTPPGGEESARSRRDPNGKDVRSLNFFFSKQSGSPKIGDILRIHCQRRVGLPPSCRV